MTLSSFCLRLSFVCAISLVFALGCQKHQETPILAKGEFQKEVSISEVPKDILAAFYKDCPQSKIVSVHYELGGKIAKFAHYWVFRFEQYGKLRLYAIGDPRESPSGSPYDVHIQDVTP